jgi:hypothetical protein
VRFGDFDHLMKYVGWLRLQKKRNGQAIGDRYVANIFSTLGTFALAHGVTTPNKKVLSKLGYANKLVKAHPDRELQLMWAAMTPDEELLYRFFLWSLEENRKSHTLESGFGFHQ